jgi:hypothetical protein
MPMPWMEHIIEEEDAPPPSRDCLPYARREDRSDGAAGLAVREEMDETIQAVEGLRFQ